MNNFSIELLQILCGFVRRLNAFLKLYLVHIIFTDYTLQNREKDIQNYIQSILYLT